MSEDEFYEICYDWIESCYRNGYTDEYRNYRDFERENRSLLRQLDFDWEQIYQRAEDAF